MKHFLQKQANGIMVRLFGAIPFKNQYKHPQQKIEWNGFIHRTVDHLSQDTRAFTIFGIKINY